MGCKQAQRDGLVKFADVKDGLGHRIAIAEAILLAEQETGVVMFVICCLLLANYKSLHLYP
jgi:hypothetical protein